VFSPKVFIIQTRTGDHGYGGVQPFDQLDHQKKYPPFYPFNHGHPGL
ncbi:MAG: hypothetical protein AVDCRST_MAG56-3279, partial [uncultured Cytophagales bacterium]